MMTTILRGKLKGEIIPVIFHTQLHKDYWAACDLGSFDRHREALRDRNLDGQEGRLQEKEIVLWSSVPVEHQIKWYAGKDNYCLWFKIDKCVSTIEFTTNRQALPFLIKN